MRLPRTKLRLFSQDEDQDFIIVLEAPRDQDLGLEDYIAATFHERRYEH